MEEEEEEEIPFEKKKIIKNYLWYGRWGGGNTIRKKKNK